MKSNKTSKKVVPESSFVRGWSQIPPCYQSDVRKQLMDAFKISSISCFYSRLRGETELKKSQASEVERIFLAFGITEVWGVEAFKPN